jgi:hypothetical protein
LSEELLLSIILCLIHLTCLLINEIKEKREREFKEFFEKYYKVQNTVLFDEQEYISLINK